MKEVKFKKNFYSNRGEKCFIFGNGPSLNKVDFSLFENHIVIGVNLILYSGFAPDFLCVSDRDMIVDNYEKIISDKMNKGYYLISTTKDSKLNHLLQSHKNVRLIDGFKEDKQERFPYIDPELKKFAITKNGVINDLAISLAIYLGFEEIFLLGVDGQHGTNTHFYDCEGVENKKDSIVRSGPEPVTYKMLLPVLKDMGIKVYNCSENNKHAELQYVNCKAALRNQHVNTNK